MLSSRRHSKHGQTMAAAHVCKLSQIFPLRYRGRGVSLTVCVNRLTSGLVALAFPLLERGFTAGGTFFLFSIFSVGTVWFYYVRKRGRGEGAGRRWGGLRKTTLLFFLSRPALCFRDWFLLGCAYFSNQSLGFLLPLQPLFVVRSTFLPHGLASFLARNDRDGILVACIPPLLLAKGSASNPLSLVNMSLVNKTE